jgi:dienelactone hydrolase
VSTTSVAGGRRALAALAALALLASACSGEDGNEVDGAGEPAPAETTTTSLTPDEAAVAYAERGPYPVGITTLELDGEVPVEVWYPAAEGTTGEDTYDVRDLVPSSVRALLTADVPAAFTIDAGRDADAADGEFPLVLFSHGFTGIRQQSSFLTSHLASWGMVVAAPDHWSRDLYHVLGELLGEPQPEERDDVDDLRRTRDLLAAESASDDSVLSGHVGTDEVAAVGHSAGGGTVLGFAGDDGVAGYVSLASGGGVGRDDQGGEVHTLPDTPSMFLAGRLDGIVPWDTVTRAAYEAAPEPSDLWVLDGVGHNGFDDFCTFGGGTGIIGVAEASGLGPVLDAQPQFRALGEDGCLPPAAPVGETFPVVRHAVTAWLRHVLGLDSVRIGLGPDVAGAYPVGVEISSKP